MDFPKPLYFVVAGFVIYGSTFSEAGTHTPLPEYPNQDTTRIEMFVSSTSSSGHIAPLIIYNDLGKVIYLK